MNERIPMQKEFGEIQKDENTIKIKKIGLSTKEHGKSKETAGRAELTYLNEPIPHYRLVNLDIFRRADQGKGFASQLLAEVESVSREAGMPVVLTDAILQEDSPQAYGMYAKRKGWTEIQDPRYRDPEVRYYVFGTTEENAEKLTRHLLGEAVL